jgi:FkbM family methyltransferase
MTENVTKLNRDCLIFLIFNKPLSRSYNLIVHGLQLYLLPGNNYLLKRYIQFLFQHLLGIDLYLLLTAIFQWFVIRMIRPDKELLYFIDRLPVKGIIVDAGAKYRPKCQIIAFEPVPANLRCLKKMVSWFGKGNIKLYETALADCSGQLLMYQPIEKGVQMHGLSRVAETPESSYPAFDVPAVCLNDIPELQPPVNWVGVKIDVENFEWYVLQGGVEVIKAARPIIYCEIWDTIRRDLTLQLLRQLNYSPYVLHQNKPELFTGQPALNFFLIPDNPYPSDRAD